MDTVKKALNIESKEVQQLSIATFGTTQASGHPNSYVFTLDFGSSSGIYNTVLHYWKGFGYC